MPFSHLSAHTKGVIITFLGGLALSFDIPVLRLADGNVWSVLFMRSILTVAVAIVALIAIRMIKGHIPRLVPGWPGVIVACLYAASTVFFGYAARLWSVAVGSVLVAGRCVSLDAEGLLWRSDSGALNLHIRQPCFGGSAVAEVLDGQLAPLIDAWRDIVAPGLLWGNAASALRGTGEVLDAEADAITAPLFCDPRLGAALDPESGRRRSCCLFYRTPSGGVCGDCPFPASPLA